MARSNECVKVLCDYGADPYVCDDEGRTALHDFFELGMGSCVDVLLRLGCREDMKDHDGLTPAQLLNVCRVFVAKYFSYGAQVLKQVESALTRIISDRAVQDMKWLVSQPCITDYSSDAERFRRWLRKAAAYKSWTCLEILLSAFVGDTWCLAGLGLEKEGFIAIAPVLKAMHPLKLDLAGNNIVRKEKDVLSQVSNASIYMCPVK
jgi:hypothetical protein